MTDIDLDYFPNFLIVGANKAGTTSIYYYCNQHPQILMSKIKEPMFFTASDKFKNKNVLKNQVRSRTENLANPKVITSLEDYQNLFFGGKNKIARGEASTSYLANPNKAIPKIKSLFPEMKIIACLRNPVERAFSCYCMYHSSGLEKRSFDQAILDEINGNVDNIPQGQRYLKLGLYYSSVKSYLQAFGEDQVLIVLFDNLKKYPLNFMKNIFNFLQVDNTFIPSTEVQLNTSSHWLNSQKKPQMSKRAAQICQDFFENDLKKLQEIIPLQQTNWLKR